MPPEYLCICAACRHQVEREVRLHISLDHPHIVRLYAAFEDADHVYLVQVRYFCTGIQMVLLCVLSLWNVLSCKLLFVVHQQCRSAQ